MRKLIAILLGAVMMLSMAVVGVSAADPEVITTAEQFAAMAADGNYKLGASIAVAARYNGTFKGTFDGAGFTITLSGDPAFKTLDGATVSNLTLEGRVSISDNAGALCVNAYGVTITKVTNKASVETTKSGGYAGGLIGQMSTASSSSADNKLVSRFTDCVNEGAISGAAGTVRIAGFVGNAAKHNNCIYTRCINKGDISAKEGISGSPYVAGIAGSAFGGEFYDCENYGKLYSAAGCHMGGILGRMSPSAQGGSQDVIITGCKNYGELVATSGVAGGIVGYAGNPAGDGGNVKQVLTVKNCENSGKITAGGGQAGGIVGYLYGVTIQDSAGADRGYWSYADIQNCVNKGDITGTGDTTFVSQIMAYANVRDNIIKNNYGLGTVAAKDDMHAVFIGLSGDDVTLYNIEGNYVTDSTKYYAYAADEANARNRIEMSADLADKVRIATVAEIEAAMTPPTQQGGDTPAVVTGDTALIVMIVCLVSLLGMGIALKARRA